jgi:hypothetical protein
MPVVPLRQQEYDYEPELCASEAECMSWIGYAAGGTLIVGGLLLLTGKRRAGTVAAASGAALALLDQKETLNAWWNALPGYIDDIQRILDQVQGTIEEIAIQRENLRRIFDR